MHLKGLDSIILQGITPTKVQYYNHKKETTLATPSIGNTLRAFTLLHSTGEHMMTSTNMYFIQKVTIMLHQCINIISLELYSLNVTKQVTNCQILLCF